MLGPLLGLTDEEVQHWQTLIQDPRKECDPWSPAC
jgi:hypothetical protein